MDIAEIFKLNYAVDSKAIEDFVSMSEICHFKKGQMLVEHDRYCGYLFLVKSGIMGVSVRIDGEEETICFGENGCGFMDFNCYYKHEPAFLGCMAHTQLEAYRIDFTNFNLLLEKHVSLLRWFTRALIEEFYLLEVRANNYRKLDAHSRYEIFMKSRPHIFKMISAKYIAQYLRIRPETLYRMRAKYLKKSDE